MAGPAATPVFGASDFGNGIRSQQRAKDFNPLYGGILGYGMTSGSLYVGGELRGELRDQVRTISTIVSPAFTGSSQIQQTTARIVGSGDAAIRVGVTFDDYLLFARAGGGAAVLKGRSYLGIQSVSPISILGGTTTYPQSVTPYLLFGLGVEKSFGSYFARADAEILNYIGSDATYSHDRSVSNRRSGLDYRQFYDGRVTFAAGYRW